MHNHNYESIIYTEPGNANKLYFSNFEHFDINYMESTRNKCSFLIRQKPKNLKNTNSAISARTDGKEVNLEKLNNVVSLCAQIFKACHSTIPIPID